MRDPRYDPLFEPIRIGPVTAKNRFFQVPHCNGMGHAMPLAHAAMREVKAEGGWGVISTEECEIHPSSDLTPYVEARLWDDRDIPALALMCDKVHAHGALAALELSHNGPTASNLYSREVLLAPSHQPSKYGYPSQARAMDLHDIAEYRRWHREAAGYKIRHVPATLPDILKTRAVVEWEYRDTLGGTAAAAISAFETQLDHLRGARSDYEIALPLHEITSFAQGTGYWAGLPLPLRRAQMDHLITLCDTLYPSLRLYLFDAHKLYSSPVTLFGPHARVPALFHQPGRCIAADQRLERPAARPARNTGRIPHPFQ